MGHESFVGRLAIPYLTRAGVRTIKFRSFSGDDGPKYLGLPGARGFMYNPSALLAADTVAVCEGELDALVCSAVVGIPAVGVPGVSTWKPHFSRMFQGIPRVLVFADDDDKPDGRNPGKELGDRVCRELEQAVFVQLPKGMDLTDVVVNHGAAEARRLAGLPPADVPGLD